MKLFSYVFIFFATFFVASCSDCEEVDEWDDAWDLPCNCSKKNDSNGFSYWICQDESQCDEEDCYEPPRQQMFNPILDPLVIFFKKLVSCCFIDGLKYQPCWKNCSIVKFTTNRNASYNIVPAMSIGPQYNVCCIESTKTKVFQLSNPNKTSDCAPCKGTYPSECGSTFAASYCKNCTEAAKYCTTPNEEATQQFNCLFGINL